MNSVTLVAFLVLTCTSRGGGTSYSDFTELDGVDFPNEFFEDEVVLTSHSEDSTQGLTAVEFFVTDLPQSQSLPPEDQERIEGEGEETRSEEHFKHPLEDPAHLLSALNEVNAEKRLGHFLVHPFDYQNSKTPFQNEEAKSYQTPKRREIKEWSVSDDFYDWNNVPWGVDAYFPRLGHSEFIQDASFSEDKSQEGPSVIVAGDFKDHNTNGKHPQYFQKNYYYNYYPLINDRKRWSSEDLFISEDSKKRLETGVGRKNTPNPCRQYLEFLKYAFERLDDNSEYYYEPNEEYTEEWRDRDTEKNHRVFGTQLLGPTFYIDNSGKISQVNTNGNSIQVAEGISPESKISIFAKVVTTEKPTTQETFMTTTEQLITEKIETDLPTLPPRTTPKEPERRSTTPSTTPTTPSTTPTTPSTTPTTPSTTPTTTSTTSTTTTTTTTPTPKVETTKTEDATTTHQEYYGRMARPMNRRPFIQNDTTTTTTTTTTTLKPHVHSPRTTSSHRTTALPPTIATPVENVIQAKTVLTFEDSTDDKSDEADCKDKMLPCPDTVNITYPLNGYCNRYVSCESGRAIRRTCPEGLHFNLIIKSCDLPHNSFCTYVCPQPNGHFGIPGDCGGYFVCKNSNPEYRMCPPRMHWDISRGICTFSQLSSCPMKCLKDNEVKHYEGDCKAYIVCLNGIPYYHKCPPNTKFDRTSLVCVPDHSSNCVDDPRLLTNTLNPNALCKDVQIQLNTKSWCRAFLPFDKQKS